MLVHGRISYLIPQFSLNVVQTLCRSLARWKSWLKISRDSKNPLFLSSLLATRCITMSDVYFYKYLVNHQVFFRSKYTYALVNIKPLVPGHVLVVPLRTSILRFADLSVEESQDYMLTLQLIHKFIIHLYNADSLNIAIQDGPESGQSIPHLHTHLIPRYKTDGFGDGIYEKLDRLDLNNTLIDFLKDSNRTRKLVDFSLSQMKVGCPGQMKYYPTKQFGLKTNSKSIWINDGEYLTYINESRRYMYLTYVSINHVDPQSVDIVVYGLESWVRCNMKNRR